ncbi:MAG: hypothetical protein TU36_007630, partial [Vulcanisaeta sp. AZ3]
MTSLNELIKELRINEILTALITAYKAKNIDYLQSALALIHDEFTYTIANNEELTKDELEKASILNALYYIDLGLIKSIKGDIKNIDMHALLTNAIKENDATSLAQALTTATAKALNNDYTWMNESAKILHES